MAAFCAPLVLGLVIENLGAQTPTPLPKLTTTTTSNNKYGEGGTLESTSDEKFNVVKEVWKNKDGHIKEQHVLQWITLTPKPNEKSKIKALAQGWKFYKNEQEVAEFTYWGSPDNHFVGRPGVDKYGVSRADAEKWIEKIEKEFAADGTIPHPWDEKEKLVETKVEQPEVSRTIDPELIGTWECTSFKESGQFVTGGGTGFRVTFKNDRTETVDYSNMKPIMSGLRDKTTYSGIATAQISTNDGVAKIERIVSAGVVMTVDSATGHFSYPKLPGLGPGGLGSTTDKNSYKCTEDTLEYQTSAARDGHANTTVKLTRVKGTR